MKWIEWMNEWEWNDEMELKRDENKLKTKKKERICECGEGEKKIKWIMKFHHDTDETDCSIFLSQARTNQWREKVS